MIRLVFKFYESKMKDCILIWLLNYPFDYFWLNWFVKRYNEIFVIFIPVFNKYFCIQQSEV